MPQISVSHAPVTHTPREAPEPDPGKEIAGLARMILAVKEFKQREKQQDQAKAAETIKYSQWSLEKLGMIPDPQGLTKALKTFDIDPTKVQPMPQGGGQQPQQPQGGQQPQQPPAGGGGEQGSGPQPQPMSYLDHLQQTAARTAQTAKLTDEQHQMQLRLLNRAYGDYEKTRDPKYLGEAHMLAGKSLNESEIMSMMASPETRNAYLRHQAGYMSDSDRIKIETNLTDHLMTSYKGIITPGEAHDAAVAMAAGKAMPPDVDRKITTNQTFMRETEALMKYSQIYPSEVARRLASAEAHNISPVQAMPGGAKTLKEMELGVHQEQLAESKAFHKAEFEKWNAEHAKINLAIAKAPYDEAWSMLRDVTTAKKAGIKVPQDLEDAAVGKVAALSGLAPTEVRHWYTPWRLTQEYEKNVTEADKKKVGEAAGGKVPAETGKTPGLQAPSMKDVVTAPGKAGKALGDFYLNLLKDIQQGTAPGGSVSNTIQGLTENK